MRELPHEALSMEQERMWFLSHLYGDTAALHEHRAVWIDGELDVEKLKRAAEIIVRRHEILRTVFADGEGGPRQIVLPESALPFHVLALPPGAAAWDEPALRLAQEEICRPIAVAPHPPWRLSLIRSTAHRHLLVLTMHHIISDGDCSTGLFFRELAALYAAPRPEQAAGLPELPLQYRDYARWQRSRAQDPEQAQHLAFWQSALAGAPEALQLPTSRPRPPVQTFAAATVERPLPAALTRELGELASRLGSDLFLVLLAGLQAVYHRYCGQEDILIGTPFSGRDKTEHQALIGYFGNPVVLRARFSAALTFAELLRQLRDTAAGTQAHSGVSFKDLVEALAPARDLRHPPIFQVLFLMPEGPPAPYQAGPLTFADADVELPFLAYEQVITAEPRPSGLILRLRYNGALFAADAVARLLEHWEVLLTAAARDPQTLISALPLMTEREHRLLLRGYNRTQTDFPTDLSLHGLFEAHARQTPHAPALEFGAQSLSYRELDQRANQLACHLRARGVGAETIVAICMERSLEMVVAVLGVLKAGGAYLPLDASYPQERLDYILQDARADLLLTQESLVARARVPNGPRQVLCLDCDWPEIAVHSAAPLPPLGGPESLAYVIYTSGSTGRPKGALIEHRSAVNLALASPALLGIVPGARVLQFASHGFDACTWELIMALTTGATLCIPEPGPLAGSELGSVLRRQRITAVLLPPSVLAGLPSHDDAAGYPDLALLIAGGEACSEQLVERWAPGRRFINAYGPTECTVCSTISRCYPGAGAPAIGTPLPNVRVYVLDRNRQPVPIGVPGELFIGGAGVGRGYLRREALNQEKYLRDWFATDAPGRLYRSGDLVRWRPDGSLEFLGRLDHQIKLRGFRIELGEIESALREQASVKDATALVRSDRAGEPRIVAYVVQQEPDPAALAALRTLLKQRLPDHMIPAAIVPLAAFPLTASGKVDRAALPAPEEESAGSRNSPAKSHVPPRTPIEAELAAIWCSVLRCESIGIHDDFFAAGGHSLRAAQVVSRLRERLHLVVSLRQFFARPTIAGLAEALTPAAEAQAADRKIPHAERTGLAPTSFAQERLWFMHQLAPQSSVYHYPVCFALHGPVDVSALSRSLQALVDRHESLRTTFADMAGRPVQVIAPSLSLRLEVQEHHATTLEASAEPTPEATTALVQAQIAAELRQPFELARGPLIRARLVRLGPDRHLFVINLHHIVTDGWSMDILFRELGALYKAAGSREAPPLPPLPLQYADYARWHRERAESGEHDAHLAWWRERLKDAKTVLELPTDRPRPAVQTFRGEAVPFRLPPDQTAAVRQLAAAMGATPTMVMMAALYALLHRYTGQTDLLIGLPHAGRDRAELEGVIGFFVNTLVIRCNLADEPSFRQIVAQVRAAALEAADHAALPFSRLVQAVAPQRDLRRTPLVQVMFAPQIKDRAGLQLPGVAVEPLAFDAGRAPFDLTLYFCESAEAISGSLEYSAELFHRETAEQLIRHLLCLLSGAARDPELLLSELPLMTDAERHRILVEWNRTATVYPRQSSVHTLFEEQVAKRPSAIAVVLGESSLTYAELNRQANRLAYRLMSEGVGPGEMVGLCGERSLSMVIGMLAILKAGGAYLPLDPEYPDERLRLMLAESKTRFLLSSSGMARRLTFSGTFFDLEQMPRGDKELKNPASGVGAMDRAYIMFTSGSTGKPQAVAVPHRAISRLVLNTNYVQLGPEDRILHASNQSFDAATFELWGALLSGGCAVIAAKDVLLSPAALAAVLRGERITALFLTTSVFNQVARECPDAFAAVDTLMFGGEACDAARVREVLRAGGPRRLLNVYGPTEGTTFSTWHLIRQLPEDAITAPIGIPIANTTVYVLDRRLQPVPPGVTGEIYVGGEGVALGYANSEERTRERFIADPFGAEPGARLYKTGDEGRFLRDGAIEFLGRSDQQVKIRGFRIELGEIDAAVGRLPEVQAAATVVRKTASGNRSLAVYVVLRAGAALTRAELRSRLRQELPDHMIPAAIVFLRALPLNPNGKVEKRALPDPDEVQEEAAGAANPPASALEEALAAIWREVLGLKHVGIDDLFFDLGGHSLLLAQVRAQIRERLNRDVDILTLFQRPSVRSLAAHLAGGEPSRAAAVAANPVRAGAEASPPLTVPADGIAIIGIAGRFPGAANPAELWQLLREGREGITRFSEERLRAAGLPPELLLRSGYVPAHGAIPDAMKFDAGFFGYSAHDARLIDPQQRIFLECAWEAMEDAGYDPQRCPGAVGVFGGASIPRYWLERVGWRRDQTGTMEQVQEIIGNNRDFLTSRVAYKLGLRGPALNVQAACATSLVAVHLACQHLLTGQCDVALAGGVSLVALGDSGYLQEDAHVMSADGHCRPFDAAAGGFVPASGAALVVLKRLTDALADGDTIRAVIRGSAVNNDGASRVGFTAPSVEGQTDAITRAHAAARVAPDSISYVEAHGTATQLGDLIEVKALTQAFRAGGTVREGFCALGSIKSNLGHLDAAAGVTGLIKTVLAMEHECVPATLHYERPNPALDLAASPFFVAAAARPWRRGGAARRAGVSAFGLGGTNAHVIVEEPPPRAPAASSTPAQLLVLSARTETALQAASRRLAEHLHAHPELSLADVAHTLQQGRRPFTHRRALIARSGAQAAAALSAQSRDTLITGAARERPPSLVFMFPGGHTQFVGMGQELYAHSRTYKDAIDRCAALFAAELRCDIRSFLYPEAARAKEAAKDLKRPSLNMATVFATEYALAQLLGSLGLRPAAVTGHSLGEYTAACVAGVLSLEDAVALLCLRGRLGDEMAESSMLSVNLPEAQLLQYCGPELSIAAVNSAEHCVLSGSSAAVSAVAKELAAKQVSFRHLSGAMGSHSILVEPFAGRLAERAATMQLHAPTIPIVSNVTGTWLTEADARDPAYWARHLRNTIRFADGLTTLLADSERCLIEVGPGKTLSTLALLHSQIGADRLIVTTMPPWNEISTDLESLLGAVARLFCAGVAVDFGALHAGERRCRVPLPTYPFEREEYALVAAALRSPPRDKPAPIPPVVMPTRSSGAPTAPVPAGIDPAAEPPGGRRARVATTLSTIWRELLGVSEVRGEDDFFRLGGSSLLAILLRTRVKELLQVTIPIHALLQQRTYTAMLDELDRLLSDAPPAAPLAAEARSAARNETASPPPELPPVRRSVESGSLMVCLQAGAAGRPPLFLFQPVGGTVYVYRDLARLLGPEQPVYAFRASGMEPGEPIYSDLREMVARYREELQASHPSPFYLLGGYSAGGHMAYEMACQLAARGCPAPLVFMADAPAPMEAGAAIPKLDDLFRSNAGSEEMAPSPGKALRAALQEDFPLREVIVKTYESAASYKPPRSRSDIVYFRARERDAILDPHSEAGWMDRVDGAFSVYNAPGSHFTMMAMPHVKFIAQIMRRYLRRHRG